MLRALLRRHRRALALIALALAGLPALAAPGDTPPFRDPDLSIEQRVEDLLGRLTLDEKKGFLWELSPPVERLGIPKYYHGNEALHGVVRPGNFTVFPQAIAFSATFNPELIHRVASAISDEARGRWNELDFGAAQHHNHSDLLTFWSPTVNMARDPRWGRTAETYGEDPHLASRIGVAFVRGLQGDHPRYLKVVSTPKHFVANNVETNRHAANSVVSERTLREYYLPAFRALVQEGGAQAVMSAYNAVNWVPCTGSRWLLTDLLRGEWGFQGYVVSDCGAVKMLTEAHRHTATLPEAAAAALKAGMDLECSGGCDTCPVIAPYLPEAYDRGLITMEEIDRAVRRTLAVRFRLGLFDPPSMNPYNTITPAFVGCEAHRELALEAARQSIVLLKNDGPLLPIDRAAVRSIAVVGHNADALVFGDYSGTPLNPPVTVLQGIRAHAGPDIEIRHVATALRTSDLTLVPEEFLSTPDGRLGLAATYFPSRDLTGPARARVDPQVDVHSQDNPPDPYLPYGEKSARWEGFLTPPATGEYRIGVSSDDGFRLWLGGEKLLESWVDRGETLDTTTLALERGRPYPLRLEWFDGGGGAVCRLWWEVPDAAQRGFPDEEEAARASDLVVAVVGTGLYNEREGLDKETLDLPGDQVDMLRAVHAANPNLVVVLLTGSPHTIPWIDANVPAILNAWYPGEQGGNAVAEVLFGDCNPAGRLPFTYYESLANLPAMDRYEIAEGRTYMYYAGDPIYPFGHGLSYTTFDYAALEIAPARVEWARDLAAPSNPAGIEVSDVPHDDDEEPTGPPPAHSGAVFVSFDVTNTGARPGDEVAQLYVAFPETAHPPRPLKQLRRFDRFGLDPGETRRVRFDLTPHDLAFWNPETRRWELEPGPVQVMIGPSSGDLRLVGAFDLAP